MIWIIGAPTGHAQVLVNTNRSKLSGWCCTVANPIGAGDSADVYAARSAKGEPRALKIMADKTDPASKRRARFAQEAEAIVALGQGLTGPG